MLCSLGSTQFGHKFRLCGRRQFCPWLWLPAQLGGAWLGGPGVAEYLLLTACRLATPVEYAGHGGQERDPSDARADTDPGFRAGVKARAVTAPGRGRIATWVGSGRRSSGPGRRR